MHTCLNIHSLAKLSITIWKWSDSSQIEVNSKNENKKVPSLRCKRRAKHRWGPTNEGEGRPFRCMQRRIIMRQSFPSAIARSCRALITQIACTPRSVQYNKASTLNFSSFAGCLIEALTHTSIYALSLQNAIHVVACLFLSLINTRHRFT